MCRIFSSFLISLVDLKSLAQAACISILAVVEAMADHERGRCGNADPYADVLLSVLRGKNLLSQLFLYQQIKLLGTTRGAVSDGVI